MKLTRGTKQQASTLVVTIILSALIGSVMCSYLVLVGSRNETTMRGMAWNTAIPVLEAGVEEALTHLQVDTKQPTASQWEETVLEGQTAYWKRSPVFPDGSFYCVTNVNVSSTTPLIYAAGYVRAPLKANEYISRLVKVSTTNPPSVFTHAIAANGSIRLSGNALVDGYNSSLGFYSSSNRNASGSIATDSQQPKAIDIGSGHVCGTTVTGPNGTVSVAGGSIGDIDWPLHAGIQGPEWINNDMNVQFQDVELPDLSYQDVGHKTVGVTNMVYLGTGAYKMDEFNSNSSKNIMVIVGQATLWVKGSFTVSGPPDSLGYVYIADGASLKLYVGGQTAISGGGVVNVNKRPADFSYCGLPTSTSLFYSGQADFYGTINAPQAGVRISGDSSVYGAVICNTFTSSGNAGVHYDQSLGGGGIFMVTSWREL